MTDSRTLLYVVGARPNFMKMAPLIWRADQVPGWTNILVHTGQHYNDAMSDAFFRDLGVRQPDIWLGAGSGSHGAQTARVLAAIEDVLVQRRPDLVVVVGDVNSTLAAALAAVKLRIPVAHVEAGLRSGDRRMPEEINRILTDQIADLCLTPSRDAHPNLLREGIAPARIHFVGNIMIDTLLDTLESARQSGFREALGLRAGDYVVATLHRPSNVDDRTQLAAILSALGALAEQRPVILPLHPRTRARVNDFGLDTRAIRLLEPLGYREMLNLQDGAALVLTDSGGLQEETTVLGVPCLTLRDTTERPVTLTEGTNRLVPVRTCKNILDAAAEALARPRSPCRPEGWDGHAADRIVNVIQRFF